MNVPIFILFQNNMQKNVGKDKILELEAEFTSRVDGVGNGNEEYGSMSEIASCSYEARALGVHNGMFMGSALRLSPNLKTIPYDFEAYREVAYILYNTVAQYILKFNFFLNNNYFILHILLNIFLLWLI